MDGQCKSCGDVVNTADVIAANAHHVMCMPCIIDIEDTIEDGSRAWDDYSIGYDGPRDDDDDIPF